MTDTKTDSKAPEAQQIEGKKADPAENPQAPASVSPPQPQLNPIATPSASLPVVQAIPRDELLRRARTFLTSPQVQYQDLHAKRSFLREKGLNESEVDELLRTLPPQLPSIPPRTYPLPPPSNLPVLLLALARLFSWIAGGSAALLFVYHRLLLPRIAQSSLARHSLKSHHVSLLRQLTTSLASLKESQAESFSVLPRTSPWNEPKEFSQCHSVNDITSIIGEKELDYARIPALTLLRCGISDFSKGNASTESKPTTEDLFRYLEERIPWLTTEDGLRFEHTLWDMLSTTPLFNKVISSSISNASHDDAEFRWEYVPPTPPAKPPLLNSLDSLSSALPKKQQDTKSPFQHTLQSLSDFTGYISTQIYLPYRPTATANTTANTVEDEVRREVKALKGLVLNRRSFMASIPRPSFTP